MKRLLSIYVIIISALFAIMVAPVRGDSAIPDLTGLYQQADADHLILVTFADQSINSIPDAASGSFYRKRGTYQSTSWSERTSTAIAEDHHLTKLIEWPMTEVDMHCVVYRISIKTSMAETLKQLSTDSRLEIVQPMQYFKTQSHHYNDPYYQLQTNMQQMQVDQVHTKTTGRKVNIAMIDTGVALDHPDLIGQITDNQNFAYAISPSFNNDKHGTAVAGIMVAQKDNATGITGVAPDAKLIALKACWPDQVDDIAAVCNSLTLALAINTAIKAKVDILNMSLTGPNDPLLTVLLNKAIEKGILVVAANANLTNNNQAFPASLKNVIAVQSLSLPGQTKQHPTAVTAFSERILTTLPPSTYDFISGSSIAAAEVSGVIALLLELKRDLTLPEIQEILQKSALPTKAGSNTATVINANHAVLALCKKTDCPD